MKLYTAMADDELVGRYAQGENEAFDALLERHQDKLFNYIFFVVHDRDVANDIFQDAFMKAIVTIKQGRYVESGKFAQWITRIARNLIIDHFRGNMAGASSLSTEVGAMAVLNDIRHAEGTIEADMVQLCRIADLRHLLQQLPASQREVVYMRYYQEMTFKEIADITGVSINTSLGRMRYALINLRRMISRRELALA